jgi:cytochrome c-type biogenesis protein CcsB
VPNAGLAQVSNVTLVLAIATYAVAMLAYACDFAFGKRQSSAASAPSAASPTSSLPELVGVAAIAASASTTELAGHAFPADPADPAELADLSIGRDGVALPSAPIPSGLISGSRTSGSVGGNGASADGNAADDGTAWAGHAELPAPAPPAASQSRWPVGTWQRLAFLLTCVGLALQLAAVATRGLSEHRIPWGNMYEFIAAITCAAVVVLVFGAIRFRAYYLGLFVLLPVVLALAVDVVVIYTPAGQLVPALQSYWIAIHVTGMIIAIGAYIFGAVATVLYLLVSRYQRRMAAGQPTGAAGIMSRLPGADVLDRLSYRTILFAFPAWTFAVIAGAIWADHAWGRYWGWDPKETWSFIIWLVYASYLHARATAGWRGRRAAFIQLFGFACVLFNLVGVNLWISGLHSYAGLPH